MLKDSLGRFVAEKPQTILPKVKCDNFRFIRLPVGMEASLSSIFRVLPDKKELAAEEFLILTEEL